MGLSVVFGVDVWVKWLRAYSVNRVNSPFLIPRYYSQKSVGKMIVFPKNEAKNSISGCGLLDLPKGGSKNIF
jgi:hypothetical protein